MALDPSRIPEPVRALCERLRDAGHRAWVVGGCVRDLLDGRDVSDWDVATSATPKEVQHTFRRTIPTGIEHGTVTVMLGDVGYEVTTLRGEGEYTDGRRPDSVEFVSDIEEDLARRDFTVNAIAYDPLADALEDPFGGLADLDAKLIRAVRDPAERFREDGLRVLRAARFCGSLGFDLEPATEAAIPGSLDTFRKVSPERVADEWRKAFEKSECPSRAFDVMRRTGILGVTCPALAALDDATFTRSLARLDATPKQPSLRMAALLADVEEDRAWADAFLRGLRLSNDARERVLHALAHHPTPASRDLDDPALRRWLRDVQREGLDDALTLERASGRDPSELERRARAELDRGLPLAVRELPVGGKDVMDVLARPPGRYVGEVLERLLLAVYDDPSRNDVDQLRALIPENADER